MITLIKFPEETLLFGFDFSARTELSGNTVTGAPTVTVTRLTGTGTLTLTGHTYADGVAQVRIAGGTLNDLYQLVCSINTSSGDRLSAAGKLQIIRA